MAAGISDVLAYAVGTAISPVPIIAAILMLFSARARVNGPVFLLGWAIALTVVSSLGYLLSDAGDAAADSTAADSVNWFQIVIGVLFLLLAARTWRRRPAEGAEAEMPKWMAGIDSFPPGRAFVLALLLAGVNPKNLLLGLGAGSSLAVQRPSATVAAVSIAVFVAVGSLTIAGPVGYYLVGKDREDAARRHEGLAHGSQQCRDGRAVRGPRRQPHCEGHPAPGLATARQPRSSRDRSGDRALRFSRSRWCRDRFPHRQPDRPSLIWGR